ncbi:hypothetical protein BJ742DRAFT_857912 [Cladochytrium replicatum]|nr:hypothetical protein BJ742DRAFT_857912 [Cladochytrium replicatum]
MSNQLPKRGRGRPPKSSSASTTTSSAAAPPPPSAQPQHQVANPQIPPTPAAPTPTSTAMATPVPNLPVQSPFTTPLPPAADPNLAATIAAQLQAFATSSGFQYSGSGSYLQQLYSQLYSQQFMTPSQSAETVNAGSSNQIGDQTANPKAATPIPTTPASILKAPTQIQLHAGAQTPPIPGQTVPLPGSVLPFITGTPGALTNIISSLVASQVRPGSPLPSSPLARPPLSTSASATGSKLPGKPKKPLQTARSFPIPFRPPLPPIPSPAIPRIEPLPEPDLPIVHMDMEKLNIQWSKEELDASREIRRRIDLRLEQDVAALDFPDLRPFTSESDFLARLMRYHVWKYSAKDIDNLIKRRTARISKPLVSRARSIFGRFAGYKVEEEKRFQRKLNRQLQLAQALSEYL